MRCLVSGKVQGVWFRASTREQALALGLTGSALNRADGRVEVIACGSPDALQKLRDWLRHGPSTASVDRVVCESLPYREVDGFGTG
jgi:acylphosphatase